MTPQVHIPNPTSRGVIASLRSPCALNVTVKRGYSSSPAHLGQVLVLPSVNEPVTAPGAGTVLSIERKTQVHWDHAAGLLDTHQTLEVKIDHGGYVSTSVHGIASIQVVVGQSIARGAVLGYAKTTEIFFQLYYRSSAVDPASYSVSFRGFDGGKVPGKGRMLRAGPDFVARAVSDTVTYILGGIRYFVDKYCTKPDLLINIDFNGDGSKMGLAAIGFATIDSWNVYVPVVFSTTESYLCYEKTGALATVYSVDPVVSLRDSNGQRSVIRLERVDPLTSDAGSAGSSFDPMIGTWIGGVDGMSVPVTNGFRLLDIPAGTYDLYLYAGGESGDATDFYLSVNSDPYSLKTATQAGSASFVEDENYVLFGDLVLSSGSTLDIRVLGFLAGLQLRRQ